jgi:hypothetical protein
MIVEGVLCILTCEGKPDAHSVWYSIPVVSPDGRDAGRWSL